MSTIRTQAQRTIGRLKQAWADMDYAQRRLVEINLDIPPHDSRRLRDSDREQLEALYRLEA